MEEWRRQGTRLISEIVDKTLDVVRNSVGV